MRVTVRLSGPLKERLGPRIALDLEPGASVRDVLETIAAGGGLDGPATDGLAVVSGGTIVSHEQPLADGDELAVLAPVAGG